MIKGFDVSSWQDNPTTVQKIDWEKAKSQDSKFVFIRALYANSPDRDFSYNWEHSKGLLRGAYQFYDYRFPVRPQAEAFIALMKGDWGELPPVIDVETVYANGVMVPFPPSSAYQQAVITWLKIIEDACKKRPIIYTGQNIIKYGLKMFSTSELTKYPLWIAEYRTPTGNPNFTPWPSWVFWQYGTPAVGLQYGMESKELDCNLYNGDLAALQAFAGLPPSSEPPLTLEQRVERLEKLHNL
jgi:lysozyme